MQNLNMRKPSSSAAPMDIKNFKFLLSVKKIKNDFLQIPTVVVVPVESISICWSS